MTLFHRFRRDPDRCPARGCRLLRGLCVNHREGATR